MEIVKKDISDLFLPYDISKKLFDCGFSDSCIASHRSDTTFMPKKAFNNIVEKDQILAPTMDQAIDWLFENHQIQIIPHSPNYRDWIFTILKGSGITIYSKDKFSSRKEALNSAINQSISLIVIDPVKLARMQSNIIQVN